jgi:hypothetical protein
MRGSCAIIQEDEYYEHAGHRRLHTHSSSTTRSRKGPIFALQKYVFWRMTHPLLYATLATLRESYQYSHEKGKRSCIENHQKHLPVASIFTTLYSAYCLVACSSCLPGVLLPLHLLQPPLLAHPHRLPLPPWPQQRLRPRTFRRFPPRC